MHTTRMSFKAIGRHMGYHYAVASRLVRKHTHTNNMKDLPRSGRPRVTSDRDDRALQRLFRRMPFATSPALKQNWLSNRRLSTRTVRNRLKSEGLKSRRVIKRPLLADRHRRTRKLSSRRRFHEAEIGSRQTNGSCAMSLNSIHVVLNTMPNVFVDVGLPTVDV
jgi:hypothetical protein